MKPSEASSVLEITEQDFKSMRLARPVELPESQANSWYQLVRLGFGKSLENPRKIIFQRPEIR